VRGLFGACFLKIFAPKTIREKLPRVGYYWHCIIMVVFSKFRIVFVTLVCLLGALFALPNLLPDHIRQHFPGFLQKTISLGLDLSGGSHLQLEVDVAAANKDYLNNILSEVRKTLRKNQIKYKGLRLENRHNSYMITLTLLNEADTEKAVKCVSKIDENLVVSPRSAIGALTATLSEKALVKRNSGLIEQSIEVVRRRIDATGIKEPNIQRQGEDRIVVELAGVSDPAEVRKLLKTTAKLTFQWVDESVAPVIEAKGTKVYLPTPPVDAVFVPDEREDGTIAYRAVKKEVIIQGDTLVNAQASFSEGGQPAVSIKFNDIGRQQMYEASKNHGKAFAIILDKKILSSPVFKDVIPGGSAQISGNLTVAEANALALLLRAGALPAPLQVVEESIVGPSLGADSIVHGKNATILAFIAVALFMIFIYASSGVLATIALMVNMILLFAGLSLLGATLTLPGIAGIALTIGMAVDANVLVFERIREEIRTGVRVLSAISQGYRRAFSAILDSNLTTIIGAWILYCYSTGAVKGFAVTLALGVIISMFTALTLTQMLLVGWVRLFNVKKL
jgi:protein-export membrane protein SecD